MNLALVEKQKYETIWAFQDYRKYSPGMENVARFMEVIQPPRNHTIIDIGCGEGKAGLEFHKAGLRANWLDITDAALSPDVDRSSFIQQPIWGFWRKPLRWDYGFCCDVMEHIPPEYVMLCLDRITTNCRISWLQVCNLPDSFGGLIGQPLHLTVQPFTWWRDRLKEVGTLLEARDLCGASLFVVEA